MTTPAKPWESVFAIGAAEVAAQMWRKGEGLSLADRLCLAWGDRLGVPVLTADRAGATKGRVEQIG